MCDGSESWIMEHLPWVEYATSSLVSAASGMSPFLASLGYQPPFLNSRRMRWQFPQYGQICSAAGSTPPSTFSGKTCAGFGSCFAVYFKKKRRRSSIRNAMHPGCLVLRP